MQMQRFTIELIPETAQDRAFLEDTIGLKREGCSTTVVRVKTPRPQYRPYGIVLVIEPIEYKKVRASA